MSKPKIIAIVGGGITGCVSALYAAKKNLNVHLIEKDKNLGGILKDVSFQGHNYYRACQYFNPESKWYREIPFKELDLINFDHDKATYTDIFNEKSFEKDIAGPVIRTDFKFKKEINIDIKNVNLSERLKVYPQMVSSKIQQWFKMFKFDTNFLSSKSATPFAIGRIFFRKNIAEIKNIKKKSKQLDDLLGLTREEMELKDIKASLPKYGFNKFFEKFNQLLKKNNVKIHLSTVAKPIWDKNKLKLIFSKNELCPDKVIWTGNPTGLIKNYGYPTLDSMHIKAKDFFCDLTDRVKKNIYIQIYSSNIPISRIFFYNLNGKGKITIESLRMNLDEKEIVKFVKKILDKLNLKNNIKTESLISSFKKKYFLISKKDDETIQKFINETASSNLIHGNWLEHGRDQKIDYILKQMDF